MRPYARCMRTERSLGQHFTRIGVACVLAVLALQFIEAQETTEKITVDDVDRTFLVRLPKGYEAGRPYPVVILLHGMNQEPDDIERLTGFDQLADKEGLILVYPSALHGRWNAGVRPQEVQETPMNPGRRRGYGYPGGGYPGGGGGGGYPGGGGGGYPGGGQQQPRVAMNQSSPKPTTSDLSIRWLTT